MGQSLIRRGYVAACCYAAKETLRILQDGPLYPNKGKIGWGMGWVGGRVEGDSRRPLSRTAVSQTVISFDVPGEIFREIRVFCDTFCVKCMNEK